MRSATIAVLVTLFAFAAFFGVMDYVLARCQQLVYETIMQVG